MLTVFSFTLLFKFIIPSMQQAALQPKTAEQLERQIQFLSGQLKKSKNPYAIQQKIKKLRKHQELINRWNWLAQ